MLHFQFIDEFDTALGQLLSGSDRERLKVTTSLLDGCIADYPLEVPKGARCSMGVQMGTSGFYVVVSLVPGFDGGDFTDPRRALFIGRVADWPDLDALIKKYKVRSCLIFPYPEPHLVQEWAQSPGHGMVQQVIYSNDGLSEPDIDYHQQRVTVDRTYALNAAYEEIKARRWLIPPWAKDIDDGDFFAQMKAPTRVRDTADGALRYRWIETGPLEHYRHAHVYDHLAAVMARRNQVVAYSWR